ncbi:hypothetical protein D9753_20995 [Streptomyces dangxiongensis]|uniref:PknH-like extracellular domain-containing protein n=1 Tax=Streptomyces dangxiongensis TaxID=1442032 RepID=A0A3G2JFD0_9ACTN|nr:hypothetical protein D9753_20995 [Streptomyces dangxiongensis]
MVAGAVVVVAVAAVAALVLARRGGGNTPSAGTPAQARDITRRVTLTPADWGPDAVRNDPYENDDKVVLVADDGCKVVRQPGVNMLGYLDRNVRKKDLTEYVTSTVMVYRDAGLAQADAARFRADAQRCGKESDTGSKARWEDIHEVDISTLKGFDDVVTAEEGRLTVDTAGRKADWYYTTVTGRTGQFLLQVTVLRDASPGQNREEAQNALTVMRGRL